MPSSINPVSWWHNMQGGAIAQDRPPPPGAADPYPNLATVPDKPVATDPKARAQIADALVADRTNAQYAASQAPLPDPSSRSASPQLFGVGTAAPPAPPSGAASASLEAASAPPPAAVGPTASGQPIAASTPPVARPSPPYVPPAAAATPPTDPAPGGAAARGAVGPQSSAMPATGGRRQMAANDAGAPLAPSPALQTASTMPPEDPASLPALPAGPPPAPVLPGAPQTVPTPVRAPRAPAAKPVVAVPRDPVAVAFAPGSAELPQNYRGPLKALADKRGGAGVIVVGYGEATHTDPHAQSIGLSLGLARAQAIAAALSASGVPAASMQVQAEAAGRGGAVRLIN